MGLLARGRQVGASTMRGLGRHAYGFAQSRVRVYGFADIDAIRAHLYRQSHLADQITRVRADDAAADDATRGLVE